MGAQGSVVATASSAQSQTGDMRYDAFGNKTYYVNTAGTFGWNAKSQYQTDASSGLMLLGNRYYDATTGRFISQDPAQDESNWYSYCGNNPLVAVDPDGLATILGMEFHADDALQGMKTGLAATASALPFGAYDSSAYRNEPGYATSSTLAAVGRDAALTAATMGAGQAISAARAATAGTSAVEAVGAGTRAAEVAPRAASTAKAVAGKITGYRGHGIDQAISREGHGVAARAILDAVRNPVRVIAQSEGRMKFVGSTSTVVLNRNGQVITTIARSSSAFRLP